MTGCGTKIENAYDTYSTDYINGYNGSNYFASNLCVTNDVNFGQDNMQFAKTAEGAGAFNMTLIRCCIARICLKSSILQALQRF